MPDGYPYPAEIGFALDDLVRRAAHAMDPRAAFAEPGETSRATPSQCRAADLARLRAIDALRTDLDSTARMIAHRAGSRTDAPVTYTDLGAAWRVMPTAARTRWPGALPDARPGRPRDMRHRWERYVDDVEQALRTAGVHTGLAWAETTGVDDEREEIWEGGIGCGTHTLAWNEDRGWWVILNGENVRNLPVAVNAPAAEVAAAALEHLPVLQERRPTQVVPGDRIRDLDMLWQVTDTPLNRPDGTVAVPVRDTVDPEEATQLTLSPDATLQIER